MLFLLYLRYCWVQQSSWVMPGAIGIDSKTSATCCMCAPPSSLLSYHTLVLLLPACQSPPLPELTSAKQSPGPVPTAWLLSPGKKEWEQPRRSWELHAHAVICQAVGMATSRGHPVVQGSAPLQALSSGPPTYGRHWPECPRLCQHAGKSQPVI